MIVHVVESTATGTLSMLSLLANAQADNGNNVAVVYSVREETPADIENYFQGSVRLINLQLHSLRDKIVGVYRLRSMLRECRADVLILHSSFAGFIGRLSAVCLPCRCFYIPHCISFMRRDVSWLKRQMLVALEKLASVRRCCYVAVSDSEGRAINSALPKAECAVVRNGIDTERWLNSNEWSARKSRFVTVGGIRQQKDPVRFAKIAKMVMSARPDIEFLWVGDGDRGLKSILEDSGVKVLGWRSPEDVRSILRDSRFYLSTALWEGLPVSPVEAMLSRCVAVLSDCAGNVDVVEHGKTGIIFSSDDEAVEIIISLVEDDTLGSRLSVSGSDFCRKNFSADRYVREMCLLIQS